MSTTHTTHAKRSGVFMTLHGMAHTVVPSVVPCVVPHAMMAVTAMMTMMSHIMVVVHSVMVTEIMRAMMITIMMMMISVNIIIIRIGRIVDFIVGSLKKWTSQSVAATIMAFQRSSFWPVSLPLRMEGLFKTNFNVTKGILFEASKTNEILKSNLHQQQWTSIT